MYRFFILLGLIAFFSCGGPKNELVELDLLDNGVPLKIMAPEGAVVEVDDLGIIRDVTVKDSLGYFVQIFASKANSLNPAKVLEDQKTIVQEAPYFSKFTEEMEDGFIFEKKIDDETFRYDFRYIRIQGDDQYIFQTGLSGGYDEAAVQRMYQAVQQ